MRCPGCGLEVPAGFRFCGSCGTAVAAAAPARPEEERKLVTALFCDLAGFTEFSEARDPEDVRRMLSSYFRTVRGEVARYGGTVDKFIGDAIFGLFGAPRAHEDDPRRAVLAALAVLEAVSGLRAARPEDDLHVRIGITTGEALVHVLPPGQSEGMAWGDVINTAARLQAAAPVDGILVDEATYRATRDLIAYAEADAVRAKGKAVPVAAWLAIGPLARTGLDLGERRPWVDRDAEMGILERALSAVLADRTPRLVTLVGEPGIGKTSVLLELFRRVEAQPEPIRWRHGRSPPYPEGVAFWALGEMVKVQAGMLETDDAATAAGKLAAAVRALVEDDGEAARIEDHLRSLVGLGPSGVARGDQRGAAFAAWRHFIEALARERPLIVVFEDVHWADDGLLDFVEDLIRWAEPAPLLVVCTARPDLLERRPGWGAAEGATTVALGPLPEAQTRALIRLHAGDEALSPATTAAIVATSAGNPLFSVEFIRMLADRGLLGATDAPAGRAEELPVPDSLRGIIASRLDALSPDEKGLVQAASVIGRAVWPGALAVIAGRPRDWCMDVLGALERKAFLTRARRSSVGDEPEFRFGHVLMRDVAYGQMLRRRRGEIHRRTAEWLETLSPDRAVDRAEMLAHHYRCAYDLARSAGEDTAHLAERARLALRDAGDRALALHAFPAAARFFGDALDLWPVEDSERPWLLLRLGEAVYYAETRGRDVLEEACEALLAAGDREGAAEAETLLARLAHHEGRRAPFAQHLDRAVALVDGVGPTRSKAEVLVDVANSQAMAREDERAIVAATEALDIARGLGLRDLEASALAMIGITRGLSGDPGGRDDLRRSIAISEAAGSHLSAHCCGMLADLEAQLGDLEGCFELQERARRHAERFGHAGFVRWLAAERVGEGYWTGAWDEALERADVLIADAEAGTPNFMTAYCHAMRGRIRLGRGDVDGAREDAARGLRSARAAEDPQMLYPALAFAGRAAMAAGATGAAGELADDLLGLWTARLDAYPVSSWAVDLAYTLDALGRGGDLATAAAPVRTRTRWLEALLAFVAGDQATAAECFARIGSRPDEALARLRAAEALLAAGREHEAHAQLERALAFARAAGATTDLRRAESLAAAPVATRRRQT